MRTMEPILTDQQLVSVGSGGEMVWSISQCEPSRTYPLGRRHRVPAEAVSEESKISFDIFMVRGGRMTSGEVRRVFELGIERVRERYGGEHTCVEESEGEPKASCRSLAGRP